MRIKNIIIIMAFAMAAMPLLAAGENNETRLGFLEQ
jgi:hypothetical protein